LNVVGIPALIPAALSVAAVLLGLASLVLALRPLAEAYSPRASKRKTRTEPEGPFTVALALSASSLALATFALGLFAEPEVFSVKLVPIPPPERFASAALAAFALSAFLTVLVLFVVRAIGERWE